MDEINMFKYGEGDKVNEVEKTIISENAFKTLDALNKFFKDKPEETISKKDFMDLQQEVWNVTRKRFNIVVENNEVKVTKVFGT